MFGAAAFCPHPPLLVPECAPGDDAELDRLRAACDDAVRSMLDCHPSRVVCVGAASAAFSAPTGATGSMAAYGVAVVAGVGSGPPGLPLSLTIAAYFLDRAGWTGERAYVGVPDAEKPERCADLGAELVASAERVAVLAMGDGSAYDAVAAPGPLASAAVAYDEAVTKALATADVTGVLDRSPEEARELYVAGRAAHQVAAGALRSAPAGSGPVTATLHYAGSPYGVAYPVASWVAAS